MIVFSVPTTLNKVTFTLVTWGDIVPGWAGVARDAGHGPALFSVFPVNTTTETAGSPTDDILAKKDKRERAEG